MITEQDLRDLVNQMEPQSKAVFHKQRLPRKLKKKVKKQKEAYLKHWCDYTVDLWRGKAFSLELESFRKNYKVFD